jgi:two-component system sensor histidine kinase/response regulator
MPKLKTDPITDKDMNEFIAGVLKMLSRYGLKTTLAESGSAALEALKLAVQTGNPFPLIVLDAQMPGMDGFTLTQRIKADPQFKGTNIVLLTSGAQNGDAERCQEINVSTWLAKPVGEKELMNAICRMWHPCLRTEAQPELPPSPTAEDEEPRLHLLVVEDNLVNRMVATRLIEKRNHTVSVASNGREALDMIEKQKFDCVLMDVQMPVLDGLEATAAIRNKECTSGGHLPIIAMTAHAMTEDLDRCLAAGMDGYLTKPIKALDVFATIKRVFRDLDRHPPMVGRQVRVSQNNHSH